MPWSVQRSALLHPPWNGCCRPAQIQPCLHQQCSHTLSDVLLEILAPSPGKGVLGEVAKQTTWTEVQRSLRAYTLSLWMHPQEQHRNFSCLTLPTDRLEKQTADRESSRSLFSNLQNRQASQTVLAQGMPPSTCRVGSGMCAAADLR